MSHRNDDSWDREWAFRIGTFSPSFWAGVIELQLRRLDVAVAAHRERRPHAERTSTFDGFGASMTNDLGPLDADVFFLLVAVHRLTLIGQLYAARFNSSEAQRALEVFGRAAPHLKDLRDVLTHLDEYATGRGRRPQLGADGTWWPAVGIDSRRDALDLRVGTLHVEVKRTASAALELARALNRIQDEPVA